MPGRRRVLACHGGKAYTCLRLSGRTGMRSRIFYFLFLIHFLIGIIIINILHAHTRIIGGIFKPLCFLKYTPSPRRFSFQSSCTWFQVLTEGFWTLPENPCGTTARRHEIFRVLDALAIFRGSSGRFEITTFNYNFVKTPLNPVMARLCASRGNSYQSTRS